MASDFDLSTTFIPSLYKPSSLLPIARHKQSLLYLIETYPVTIVVGQTGSGKTTQLPQYLDQAGWTADGKVIGVTQVASAGGCHNRGHESCRRDGLQCRRRGWIFDPF
ncbi:hypothetical protein C8Q69DRAFT_32969 [Paecilomyces variotii]|uniref:P-loop containing nucleoside triphosphate hydrolase protein n=1 Tax=Byssochlamys spectabilis TaxID=264951 RepID=A0A443I6E1_BYSSP|nr:hypothetical protein C8Q69DRAFT_32969 [Paecilomyces variotii]RWQ99680.1 hypothetical protein C8Q69DRAFT_32969 [Paecilomyces variotii]